MLRKTIESCYLYHKHGFLLKYSSDLCENERANLRYVKATEILQNTGFFYLLLSVPDPEEDGDPRYHALRLLRSRISLRRGIHVFDGTLHLEVEKTTKRVPSRLFIEFALQIARAFDWKVFLERKMTNLFLPAFSGKSFILKNILNGFFSTTVHKKTSRSTASARNSRSLWFVTEVNR